MKPYLILGPEFENNHVKESFARNNLEVQILNHQEAKLDCENLNFPDYANVIIYGHGYNMESLSILYLCNESDLSNIALNLISKDKAHSFELYSCFSGAAINNDLNLSKWSTLITSTSESNFELASIQNNHISNLEKVNTSNPFIKFVHYIYLVPDVVQFAIQSDDIHIYSTKNSFNEIEDFSNEALNEWRNIGLRKFIEFTQTIQTKMNPYRFQQIN